MAAAAVQVCSVAALPQALCLDRCCLGLGLMHGMRPGGKSACHPPPCRHLLPCHDVPAVQSVENQVQVMGQFYGLPMASVRAAAWRQML